MSRQCLSEPVKVLKRELRRIMTVSAAKQNQLVDVVSMDAQTDIFWATDRWCFQRSVAIYMQA